MTYQPSMRELEEYDRHNPHMRLSADSTERMYGRCGCRNCQSTRATWAEIPSPIDRPGRTNGTMSSINMCERQGCGAMATGAAIGSVSVAASGERDAERFALELCPGCIGDVMALLNTRPTTERQRAYREGWRPAVDTFRDPVTGASTEQLAAALLERLMSDPGARKAIEERRDEHAE